jgi:general secretion pathway protein A
VAAVLIASVTALVTRVYLPAPAPALPAQPEIALVAPPAPAATTEPTAAPETPPTFAAAINDSTITTDLETAMANLAALWSLDYHAGAGIVPCDRIAALGLNCFRGVRGTWSQMRRMDHPAVLKLVTADNSARYAVLSGMDADNVTLQLNDLRFTVPLADVDAYWRGEYLLLWDKPNIGVSTITANMHGVAVKWLRGSFNRIDAKPEADGPAAASFDAELSARVKAFQKTIGLRADGIVGEQTMIHLIAATPDARLPRLAAGIVK